MSSIGFKDYFSDQANAYARHRPGYPDKLFHFLSGSVSRHDHAIDCATGSGQAARGLAGYFSRVTAIEASRAQLRGRHRQAGIHYVCGQAESLPVHENSADLITVAQAFHWFDAKQFYHEVLRILKPGGILALWWYTLPSVNEAVDRIMYYFYEQIVGEYWPPERRIVEQGYAIMPSPFEDIPAPGFEMKQHWDVNAYLGFLRSWSATQNYIKAHNDDPLLSISTDLQKTWGDSIRTVEWPVHMRTGRLNYS
jgi:SAM-dependent methyltransferase